MKSVETKVVHKGHPCRFAKIAASLAVVMTLIIGVGLGQALAGQVVLSWDANTDPDLAGYKVYYGTASGTYGTPVNVGNVTTYTVTGLADGQKYYFAATAFDTLGSESGYSNEVVYTTATLAKINLVGNALSIANGDTTPSTADGTDFGSADIAGVTVVRTFTIQNTGTQTLTLSGTPLVAVSGANAADFTVTAVPSASIAAAGSTTFSITFDPSAAGARAASLTIASNDAVNGVYVFAILGTGTAAPKINLAGNTISIASGDTTPATADGTDFGSADTTGVTVVHTFTIQNTGSGALTLSGTPLVAVSGANAADFAVTTQPAASVAAAGSTTFSITFDPAATGTRIATVSIANSDATKNPYTFAIQGTGTAAPKINLVGNGLSIANGDTTPSTTDYTDFGKTKLTGGTVVRTFTIQNTGSGALTLTGSPLVAVSGASAADFTVTTAPSSSIAAAGSTTFSVTFDPSTAATLIVTLSIASSDATKSPYTFAVQGIGVAPPGTPKNFHVTP